MLFTMQTSVAPGAQELARLVAACDAAMARVAAKDGDVFAELGEALFWLYALAEATGKAKDGRFRGLAWARNKIGHGVLVTAPIKPRIFGSEPGMAVPGLSIPGTSSRPALWLHVSEIVLGSRNQPTPDDERAYEANVAGRPVLDVLRDARANLR